MSGASRTPSHWMVHQQVTGGRRMVIIRKYLCHQPDSKYSNRDPSHSLVILTVPIV